MFDHPKIKTKFIFYSFFISIEQKNYFTVSLKDTD